MHECEDVANGSIVAPWRTDKYNSLAAHGMRARTARSIPFHRGWRVLDTPRTHDDPAFVREQSVRPERDRPTISEHATAIIVVVVCMVAGLILRWLLATRSGLWRDEALFLSVVQLPTTSDMLDFLRNHESHPPLFYLVMRVWLAAFGGSDTVAMALPILIGVAQIPLLYYVGKRLSGTATGLIAAALGAFSPLLAEFSAEVRPYSLLPLLTLLSAYLLYQALADGRARTWTGYALVTLALVYTHNWAWLPVAAEWLIVFFFLIRSRQVPRSRMLAFILAVVGVVAGYSPWAPVLLQQSRHAGYPADASLAMHATELLPVTLFGARYPYGQAVAAAMLLLVTGGILYGRRQMASKQAPAMPPTPSVLLPLLLLGGVPVVTYVLAALCDIWKAMLFAHCLAIVTPCAIVVTAHLLRSQPWLPVTAPRGRQIAVWGATLLLLAVYIAANADVLRYGRSNAREVARGVAVRARPDDLIVVVPDYLASSFNHYYPLPNPEICFPEPYRVAAVPFNDVEARMRDPAAIQAMVTALLQCRASGRRVWYITNRELITHEVREGFTLPPPGPGSQSLVVINRVNQVRRAIVEVMGRPNPDVVTTDPKNLNDHQECLCAYLFDRSGKK